MKKRFLILASLFISSFELFATNYYVNGNTGNNSKDGKSVANAKKDFAFCSGNATALSPGDTVFIMDGTYSTSSGFPILNLNCRGTAAKPIVFTNYQNHTPLFKYTVAPFHLIGLGGVTSFVVVNGLTLEGNSVYSETEIELAKDQPGNCLNGTIGQGSLKKYTACGMGLYNKINPLPPTNELSHHITISNCRIHNFPGGGIATQGLDYFTVENCEIYNNGFYTVNGNSGISVLKCLNFDDHSGLEPNIIIRNNKTYNNINYIPWSRSKNCNFTDGNGIIIDDLNSTSYKGRVLVENNLSYDNGGAGIQFFKSPNGVVRNNTMYHNGKQDGYAVYQGYIGGEFTWLDATNIKVYNNIIVPTPGKLAVRKWGADLIDNFENNLILSTFVNKLGVEQYLFDASTNILNKDPQFVDAANGDFRLKCTSPAKDAGTNRSGFLSSTSDILGAIRPNGTKPDIGAYEMNCSVNTAPEINVQQGANSILNGTGTYEFNPNVAVNTTGLPTTFTIQNIGGSNLTIGNIALSGANPFSFVVTQVANPIIAPSGSRTFTISYKPAFVGPKSAIVTIANNDPNESAYTFSVTAKTTTVTSLDNEDNLDLESVSIYPNPSNNGVFNLSQSVSWKVTSILGKELKSGNSNQVNLSEQPKGVYLLKTGETIKRIVIE